MTKRNDSKKKVKKVRPFVEIGENFEQLVQHSDRFLKPQPEQVDAIHQLIQQTYAVSINNYVVQSKKDILAELVLENMDEEQIWQQLDMRNELVIEQFVKQSAQFTAMREDHLGIELDEGEDEAEEESEPENIEHDSAPEASDSDENVYSKVDKPSATLKSNQLGIKSSKRIKKSVVDDQFFKLDEMKQFLEQEDAKEMRKQSNKHEMDNTDGIDYFANDFGFVEDPEDEANCVTANYADFFDIDDELQERAQKFQNGKQKDYFNESASEVEQNDSEADEAAIKDNPDEVPSDGASEIDEADFVAKSGLQPASDSDSEFDHENAENSEAAEQQEQISESAQSSNEMREARLIQRIRNYEEVVLGEKPWQLKGEVQAANRPQNSLLEEILEFDSTARPSAPITEEQNETIDDIIKQRIRDKAWDDVERKVRPVHTPQEYRKQLVLDQEKSKQSLAQIYEQQYQRELDKLNPNGDADDSTAPESKEHQEIKRAMRSLFLKLDALSNFHFTPKPVAPEAKIVTNTPVVHMEEVAPLAVSDSKLLAPEEVFRGPKHALLGKTERTRTDKNRERRKKKQKQRAINSAIETREQQRAKQGKAPTQRETNAKLLKTITKSRNVQKITTTNDQSALKSSKAFFNKLQDTTTSFAAVASAGSKRPKKDPSKTNAKKLKL